MHVKVKYNVAANCSYTEKTTTEKWEEDKMRLYNDALYNDFKL